MSLSVKQLTGQGKKRKEAPNESSSSSCSSSSSSDTKKEPKAKKPAISVMSLKDMCLKALSDPIVVATNQPRPARCSLELVRSIQTNAHLVNDGGQQVMEEIYLHVIARLAKDSHDRKVACSSAQKALERVDWNLNKMHNIALQATATPRNWVIQCPECEADITDEMDDEYPDESDNIQDIAHRCRRISTLVQEKINNLKQV